MTHKQCSCCNETKPIELFNKERRKNDGLSTYCKVCHSTKRRAYPLKNPDLYRDTHYKHHYGITLERYNEVLKSQNGNCSICELPETGIRKKTGRRLQLMVDHDHTIEEKTGEIVVRGLLCRRCNTGLGIFLEDSSILANAIKYIEKHKSK